MKAAFALPALIAIGLAGCSPEQAATVRAKPELLVAKMGHRAELLARLGQKPYAIHGQVEGGKAPSVTLSWSSPPPPVPSEMILDSAFVTYGDPQGVEALGAWCSGPTGVRTPVLCARAQETAAQDLLINKF